MFESKLMSTVDAAPHVSWCIWHEGVVVFEPLDMNGAGSEDMVPIQSLRSQMMNLQRHNTVAMSLITQVNDGGLRQIIMQACAEIPAEFNLRENFRWVCYHEGWMPEFRIWAASGLFGYIRSNYADKQQHNPNARSLLACLRDSEIKRLVDSL